jgi:hypothetical protein
VSKCFPVCLRKRTSDLRVHEESVPLLGEIFRIIADLRDDPVALEEFGRACGEAARAKLGAAAVALNDSRQFGKF